MKKALFLLVLLCMPVSVKARSTKLIDMGEFRITYYCPCDKCSDNYGRETSTGTYAENGRTIAVDTDVISYGTKVKVGDHVYVAEDCGGKVTGDHIDVFVDTHEEVVEQGVKHKNVWIVRNGG